MPTAPFDQIPEASIPADLGDGRSGDRVSVRTEGVLYVREGLASFAPWETIYGVTELHGRLHILAPRPLPAAPWFTVHAPMVRGGVAALPDLAERIRRGRPGGGGYRDAVRHHRARLSLDDLIERVRERDTLAGGLTVPVTNIDDSTQRAGVWTLQFAILWVGLTMGVVLFFGSSATHRADTMLLGLFGAALLVMAGLGGAALAGVVVRWARRSLEPVRRVLVLAPDGCVVGLPTGVRALPWSDVTRFVVANGLRGPVLMIEGTGGTRIGAVHSRFLGGPIELIAAVANTYRQAAHD